jgi:hypothetical protein
MRPQESFGGVGLSSQAHTDEKPGSIGSGRHMPIGPPVLAQMSPSPQCCVRRSPPQQVPKSPTSAS